MILETTELDVIIKEKIDRLSNISNLLSSTTPNNESNSNSDNLESLNITNSNINSYSIYSIDQASEYNYNKSTYVKSKDSNKNKKGKQAPSTLKDKENIKSNELSKVVSDKSNTYSIIFSVSNFITALISSKNKEVEGYKNSVMNTISTYEVNFLSQLKKNVLNLEKNFNILYSSIQDLSDLLKLCNQQREEFRERLFERKSTDSLIDNNKKDTNNSSRDKNEHISIFSKGGNKLKEEFKIKAIEYHINSITKINSKLNKREKVITKLQREIKDKDYIINQLKSNNKDREINTAFNQPSSIILNDLQITPSISKNGNTKNNIYGIVGIKKQTSIFNNEEVNTDVSKISTIQDKHFFSTSKKSKKSNNFMNYNTNSKFPSTVKSIKYKSNFSVNDKATAKVCNDISHEKKKTNYINDTSNIDVTSANMSNITDNNENKLLMYHKSLVNKEETSINNINNINNEDKHSKYLSFNTKNNDINEKNKKNLNLDFKELDLPYNSNKNKIQIKEENKSNNYNNDLNIDINNINSLNAALQTFNLFSPLNLTDSNNRLIFDSLENLNNDEIRKVIANNTNNNRNKEGGHKLAFKPKKKSSNYNVMNDFNIHNSIIEPDTELNNAYSHTEPNHIYISNSNDKSKNIHNYNSFLNRKSNTYNNYDNINTINAMNNGNNKGYFNSEENLISNSLLYNNKANINEKKSNISNINNNYHITTVSNNFFTNYPNKELQIKKPGSKYLITKQDLDSDIDSFYNNKNLLDTHDIKNKLNHKHLSNIENRNKKYNISQENNKYSYNFNTNNNDKYDEYFNQATNRDNTHNLQNNEKEFTTNEIKVVNNKTRSIPNNSNINNIAGIATNRSNCSEKPELKQLIKNCSTEILSSFIDDMQFNKDELLLNVCSGNNSNAMNNSNNFSNNSILSMKKVSERNYNSIETSSDFNSNRRNKAYNNNNNDTNMAIGLNRENKRHKNIKSTFNEFNNSISINTINIQDKNLEFYDNIDNFEEVNSNRQVNNSISYKSNKITDINHHSNLIADDSKRNFDSIQYENINNNLNINHKARNKVQFLNNNTSIKNNSTGNNNALTEITNYTNTYNTTFSNTNNTTDKENNFITNLKNKQLSKYYNIIKNKKENKQSTLNNTFNDYNHNQEALNNAGLNNINNTNVANKTNFNISQDKLNIDNSINEYLRNSNRKTKQTTKVISSLKRTPPVTKLQSKLNNLIEISDRNKFDKDYTNSRKPSNLSSSLTENANMKSNNINNFMNKTTTHFNNSITGLHNLNNKSNDNNNDNYNFQNNKDSTIINNSLSLNKNLKTKIKNTSNNLKKKTSVSSKKHSNKFITKNNINITHSNDNSISNTTNIPENSSKGQTETMAKKSTIKDNKLIYNQPTENSSNKINDDNKNNLKDIRKRNIKHSTDFNHDSEMNKNEELNMEKQVRHYHSIHVEDNNYLDESSKAVSSEITSNDNTSSNHTYEKNRLKQEFMKNKYFVKPFKSHLHNKPKEYISNSNKFSVKNIDNDRLNQLCRPKNFGKDKKEEKANININNSSNISNKHETADNMIINNSNENRKEKRSSIGKMNLKVGK